MGKYITVEYIQNYIGKEFSDNTTPSKDQIELFISNAEELFDREFGDMSQQDYEEIVDGYSFGLMLSHTPVNSITHLYQNIKDEFEPEWDEIQSTEYYIDNSEIGKIRLRNPIIGRKKYKVNYNAGYSTSNVPSIVKDIIMFMVLKQIFQSVLFSDQQFGEKQTIIDVDVYREITNGGSPYTGLDELDQVIDELKSQFKNKYKAYLL